MNTIELPGCFLRIANGGRIIFTVALLTRDASPNHPGLATTRVNFVLRGSPDEIRGAAVRTAFEGRGPEWAMRTITVTPCQIEYVDAPARER
jgi:hypothetical protein